MVLLEPVTENPAPVRGSVTPLPVLIYRSFLPTNLQLTRASKTAIPLRDRTIIGALVLRAHCFSSLFGQHMYASHGRTTLVVNKL
jgi:hypothetical protein